MNSTSTHSSLYFPQQLKSGGIRFHSPVRRLARLQSTSEIPLTLSWGDNGLSAGTCNRPSLPEPIVTLSQSCKVTPAHQELHNLVPKQNLPVKSEPNQTAFAISTFLKTSWAYYDSKMGWIQVPCWLQCASPGEKQVHSISSFSHQK